MISVEIILIFENRKYNPKTLKLNENQIQIIQDYLSGKPVLRAFLFGSYVSGFATKESDIDILVELDYNQKIGLEFFRMKNQLEILLNKKVDLVSSNGISKYIASQIENDKQLIYAR